MENIKNKYDQYESPFDEMAWQHFQDLQIQEPKRNKRPFIIFLALGILCVLGWFIMNGDNTNVENDLDTYVETQRKTSQNLMDDNYSESDRIISDSSIENRVTNTHVVKPTFKAEKTSSYNNEQQNHISKNNNIYNSESKGIKSNNTETKNYKFGLSTVKHIDAINVDNHKKQLKIFKLPTLSNSISSSIKSEMPEHYPSLSVIDKDLEKNDDSNKNFIGINASYIDSYINGSRMLEGRDIVNKKGIFLSLDYHYKLNNIIHIGASGGYAYATDINNRSLEEVDYEKITFLHLNVKLYLLNEKRHKLYVKAGSGFTSTTRKLSYTSSLGDNQREEYFTKNTTTDLGLLLETGYQYQINQSLLIGTHIGSISGNDGGVYLGTSFTKSF